MGEPTFDDLMEAPRLTPRRKPILDHDAVVKGAVDWLQNNSRWRSVESEVVLPYTPDMKKSRVADVVAWNRRDRAFYIIECKASWNDFLRDHKFLEYRRWCNYFTFAVPEELAEAARLRMENWPGAYRGVGLLVIPNNFDRRRVVRRAQQQPMDDDRYLMMVEQWAASCRSRLVGARIDLSGWEYRWETRNLERRRP